MLESLLALLRQSPVPAPDTVGTPFPRRQLAVGALLLEIAQCDRSIRADEVAAIVRIVRERFGLDAATAARLIVAARVELDAALEDWVFATAVRESSDERERAEIVELLWEVVYADGELARLETSQMRRVCEELGVSDAAREAARAQAFARVGRSAACEPGEGE